ACECVTPYLERPALVVEDTLRPPDTVVHSDRAASDRIGDPARQAVDRLRMQSPHAPDCRGMREPARQRDRFRVTDLVEPEVAQRAGERIDLACPERLNARRLAVAPGRHGPADDLKPVLDDGATIDVRALIAERPAHI